MWTSTDSLVQNMWRALTMNADPHMDIMNESIKEQLPVPSLGLLPVQRYCLNRSGARRNHSPQQGLCLSTPEATSNIVLQTTADGWA